MSGDASKNMFSGGSVAGGPAGGGGSTTGFGSYEERVEGAAIEWGPSRGTRSMAALPYDLAAARAAQPIPYTTSTDRVMEDNEAGARLRGVMTHCGLQGTSDEVQYAFHMALLICMAKNSSSVLQPGRAWFQVQGGARINLFADVVSYLGEDTRRFFRAYADITRNEIRRIYDAYRAGDATYERDIRDFNWVAEDRGLRRYPTLIADGADACSGLTSSEHAALRAAKMCIFANARNMVDLVRTYRTQSAAPTISNFNPHSAPHSADLAGQEGSRPDY